MKKKTLLVAMGLLFALTACGKQQAPETASEQTSGEQTDASAQATVAAEGTDVTDQAEGQQNYVEDMVLSTDLLTITMPDEFKGKFLATIDGDTISLYDKASNEAGFGGFAFSVTVDKEGNLLPGGMYEKVGEYFDANGNCYNVCKGFPSDVQWDYTVYKDIEAAVDYNKLYNSADAIIESATANGGGTYSYKAGMLGKDLYSYNLSRYLDAFNEGWDANKFEQEGMSPEFYALKTTEGDKILDKVGYVYRDINHDGIEELIMGPITGTDEPSVVYDIYTMVDRSPVVAINGTSRDRYYVLSYGGVANEFSGGAGESGVNVYEITPNSTELLHQYSLKTDTYTDEKNPWFVNYGESESDWEAMTEEDYNARLKGLTDEYLKLDYTPLSEIAPIDYSKVDLSKYGTFTQMLADFKTGMGYANVKIGDTDVFLASSGTYNGENDTKNAIDASVFMYDDNGAIVYLGQIASSGTAYPISVLDGCLLTGGHHNVIKTSVKNGKLVTVEEASETFDTEANATYYYTTEKDGEKKVEDDTNLMRMFDEYAEATPVEFSVEKP